MSRGVTGRDSHVFVDRMWIIPDGCKLFHSLLQQLTSASEDYRLRRAKRVLLIMQYSLFSLNVVNVHENLEDVFIYSWDFHSHLYL